MSKTTHGRNVIKANRNRNLRTPALKKKIKKLDKELQQMKKKERIDMIIFWIFTTLTILFFVAMIVLFAFRHKFQG